jgi:hypothetical protein
MVAVIMGDMVASRKIIRQDVWLQPLKELFASWDVPQGSWSIERGDFFQVLMDNPAEAFRRMLEIKALLKRLAFVNEQGQTQRLDVRLVLGIGEMTYSSALISECNGPVFVKAVERLEALKKEGHSLGVATPWISWDIEMNLLLKFVGGVMDEWSILSAELASLVFTDPSRTQVQIGAEIGIKQNSVSGRWRRAHLTEILEVIRLYSERVSRFMLK